MKLVFVLLSIFAGAQARACKVTPIGGDLRAYDAVVRFVSSQENYQGDDSLKSIYKIKDGYAYEVIQNKKCSAVALQMDVGSDCKFVAQKLDRKLKCR